MFRKFVTVFILYTERKPKLATVSLTQILEAGGKLLAYNKLFFEGLCYENVVWLEAVTPVSLW